MNTHPTEICQGCGQEINPWKDHVCKGNTTQLITELTEALREDDEFIKHQFEFTKQHIRDKWDSLLQRADEYLRAQAEIGR